MPRSYNVISADSHVNPSPAIYAERLPAQFRDRAPRMVRRGDEEVAVFEGREERFTFLASSAGHKYEDFRPQARNYQEGRPGGYDPRARIADMDVDGVDADVLFGHALGGGVALNPAERPLRFAMMQVYNDWLAEFCKTAPDRLVGIAEIPHWDLDLATGEARRAAKLGLRGVLIQAIPTIEETDRPYSDPWYDPLWSALEDLSLPAHMHLGARPLTRGIDSLMMVRIACNKSMMSEPIASMIYAGVLQRHPRLKIVSVESGVGWLAFLVPWMDNIFERHRHHTKSTLQELPSVFIRRQVRATFIEDPVGIRERHTIGLDVIMWSNDYPHSDSTWPRSRQVIEEHFAGVPAAERHQIVAANAATLYHLT
ncbi:MAG: amidohydrolase [Chloroflexi bacterium]|nr:amidohydrolase [Chloroflexota bacterium]